ncbi:MAG: zeta toxin family protein [Kiritimatiellae bacterium]|nr:zeta toxin family protein [Kiritimatiellia bacterium]
MIAGPNGSGKSTLAGRLMGEYAVNLYHRVNADEILAEAEASGFFRMPVPVDADSLSRYLLSTGYGGETTGAFTDGRIRLNDGVFSFSPGALTSYTAALVADFLVGELLSRGMSLSMETVFSHPSKAAMLRKAAALGYRNYLYYVATESPVCNEGRVATRVSLGGHAVPPEKIRKRYSRSLSLVRKAVPLVSRAYFFDNTLEMRLIASYSDGDGWTLCTRDIPQWFARHVLCV